MPSRSELFGEMKPEAVRCPYPVYARLREAPPVWAPELESYVVTRFEDVQQVLQDATTFSSQLVQGPVAMRQIVDGFQAIAAADPNLAKRLREAVIARPVLLGSDGEEHRRRRELVNKAFTPKRIKVMEPQITEIANELIDGFLSRGEVELVSEFSTPLPLRVIATAIGVSEDDIESFKRWSRDIIAPFGAGPPSKAALEARVTADQEFVAYFTDRIEERRRVSTDDILSDLVRAEDGGQRLTRSETLVICGELLAAGHETTLSLITASVLAITQDRDLSLSVRAEPSRIPALVEEVLRLEGPLQGSYRMATTDTVVGGVAIEQGAHLFLSIGSADRDERQFSEADHLDLSRPNARRHMAFGRGAHACVGSLLARAEARIALEALLARLDDIELVVDPDDLDYVPSVVARGLVSLPLRFTPRSTAQAPESIGAGAD